MKVWVRYLVGRFIKTFLLFLISLFLTYTIIDLSVHGTHLIIQTDTLQHIAHYYLQNFSKYLALFFPLTFLLTSLKILIECNTHHEFTALSMGGLSQSTLLRPFFWLSFFFSFLSLINYEWIFPSAMQSMETFQNHMIFKKTKTDTPKLHRTSLKDGSELVYQQFSSETNTLFDVFWIKNVKEIWHCKSLLLPSDSKTSVQGSFVDHFQRSQEGLFEKKSHFEKTFFPEIQFNEDDSHKEVCLFEHRSLSTLAKQTFSLKMERAPILSHLQYKIATSLLCPFILYLISPIALRFQRTKSAFLITALSLFGLIGFMTILEGMLILGENQVIPSFIAIWNPFILSIMISKPTLLAKMLEKLNKIIPKKVQESVFRRD